MIPHPLVVCSRFLCCASFSSLKTVAHKHNVLHCGRLLSALIAPSGLTTCASYCDTANTINPYNSHCFSFSQPCFISNAGRMPTDHCRLCRWVLALPPGVFVGIWACVSTRIAFYSLGFAGSRMGLHIPVKFWGEKFVFSPPLSPLAI